MQAINGAVNWKENVTKDEREKLKSQMLRPTSHWLSQELYQAVLLWAVEGTINTFGNEQHA